MNKYTLTIYSLKTQISGLDLIKKRMFILVFEKSLKFTVVKRLRYLNLKYSLSRYSCLLILVIVVLPIFLKPNIAVSNNKHKFFRIK